MGLNLSRVTPPVQVPRVLIVQNNFSIRERLIGILEDRRLNIAFDHFVTPRSAAARLAITPYQIVLSDVRLAEADDCVLLNCIRSLKPPVYLLVTANASEKETACRVLEQGAFDVILHPLFHEQVVTAILLALEHSRWERLIACKNNARERFQERMKAHALDRELNNIYRQSLLAIENSICAFAKTIDNRSLWVKEDTLGTLEFGLTVPRYNKKRAMELLNELDLAGS